MSKRREWGFDNEESDRVLTTIKINETQDKDLRTMSADNWMKNCTEGPNWFLHSHWNPLLIIVCELKILQAHMSENVHTWRVYVVQSSSSSLGGNTEMVWLDVGQSLMVYQLDMHALTWYFGQRVTWFCLNSKIVLVCLLTVRHECSNFGSEFPIRMSAL